MIVILFRSRLTPEAGADYAAMQDRMDELARAAPGFVDVKAYTAEDGERLTVVRWKDLDTLRQWREDPRHQAAQEMGRKLWYEVYHPRRSRSWCARAVSSGPRRAVRIGIREPGRWEWPWAACSRAASTTSSSALARRRGRESRPPRFAGRPEL